MNGFGALRFGGHFGGRLRRGLGDEQGGSEKQERGDDAGGHRLGESVSEGGWKWGLQEPRRMGWRAGSEEATPEWFDELDYFPFLLAAWAVGLSLWLAWS
jgi:hypothetical protein